MKAVYKKAGCNPEIIEIGNTLNDLQEAVDGYIETVTFDDFVVICDEEGRYKGKPFNFVHKGIDFVGDVMFVGMGDEDFTDLDDKVADRLMDKLEE